MNFIHFKMHKMSLNLQYLSPTGFIGFWILFIGILFTGFIFYYVFFRLNENDYSSKDKENQRLEEEKQKKKIARLYPKEK